MRLLQDRGLVVVDATRNAINESPLLNQMRDKASDLVLTAMNFIGVRYQRGGDSADEGFDCSGFTRYIFENSVGLVLPRRASCWFRPSPRGRSSLPISPSRHGLRCS